MKLAAAYVLFAVAFWMCGYGIPQMIGICYAALGGMVMKETI